MRTGAAFALGLVVGLYGALYVVGKQARYNSGVPK